MPSLVRRDLELDPEVLVGHAGATLKLRLFVLQMAFGLNEESRKAVEPAPAPGSSTDPEQGTLDDQLTDLARMDPHLKGMGRGEFELVSLKTLKDEREAWSDRVKTEEDCRLFFDKHNLHLRSLQKIVATFRSAKKDYNSEKQELKKAQELSEKKEADRKEKERKKAERANGYEFGGVSASCNPRMLSFLHPKPPKTQKYQISSSHIHKNIRKYMNTLKI